MKPAIAAAAFDPNRLRVARLHSGLRVNQLAQRVDVSAAAISQYEHGHSKPSAETLARLSLALGVQPAFFAVSRPLSGLSEDRAHFRSLRSTTKLERGRAFAQAALTWDVVQLLERRVALPERDIPSVVLRDPARAAEIEAAASEVRASWSLPDGPVGSTVQLLEAHGVVTARLAQESGRVDAFSYDFGIRPLVILGTDKNDAARSRFEAIHELGHLVLHQDADAGNGVVEKQANAFAAAFLMPREYAVEVLPRRFELDRLIELKQTWGIAIAALLYRAKELSIMAETTYRRAVTSMSASGMRKAEPGDLGPAERPALLAKAIALAGRNGYTLGDLADEIGLSPDWIVALAGLDDERPVVSATS